MFIALKTKILLTVLAIVLLFTFFSLYYFPKQQGELLLKNYNNEVQNLANTVALGVRIALNEQNYEGVQTAMEIVKENPRLKFVSLLQADTIWNTDHTRFTIHESVFKTFPESIQTHPGISSNDSIVVKKSSFQTSLMSGAIMLGLSTEEIIESQKDIRHTSLMVSGGIFLIGMLIALWLSRNISTPVLALRNAAIRVGEGDLTPVVKSYSRDEIGELARAFNKMVQDLSKAREELNQINRTLSETNTTLSNTLDELKATQAQLIQSEKMASLGELTAGIAHEIQNPLNFINNFSEVNVELIDEMKEEQDKNNIKEMLNIAESIKENNLKISFHGRRADAIVKGMLQHSRKSTGQKELTDINVLADEYLRLSYHGFRAKDKSFNASFQTDFDENLGKVNMIPQDVGRVFLNIFNNAFYSVMQKRKQLGENYEPIVWVSTQKVAGKVEVRIKDNGLGIPQKVLDKIFHPFFTTKATGEGTGLGLSISYDIITKEHGGKLRVETKEGAFAEFIIVLPI
jgi:C4-dicarboxylate-specific signal transduction histidine kinase